MKIKNLPAHMSKQYSRLSRPCISIYKLFSSKAGQKYLLACHPDSGRKETAGQPISHQSPKLQLILVLICDVICQNQAFVAEMRC